jgi:hypothetical protein
MDRSEEARLYREDVYALEREAVREAAILRASDDEARVGTLAWERATQLAEAQALREARIREVVERNEVTPETALQGYLSGRWKRRHGDIYRAAAVPWFDFAPDPGWLDNTIRYRVMNIGGASTLQVIGDIAAPLPANSRARVGVLPAGFRPARSYRTSGSVVGGPNGITWAYAIWEITTTGELWTVWGVGSTPNNTTGSINAILPLD